MQFVLRSDLGGRASELPPLLELANVKITKPMVILVGGNGAGKSSLFAALRQATGLVGEGTGAFEERDGLGKPLPFPRNWGRDTGPVDLARHALLVTDNSGIWRLTSKADCGGGQ